MLQHGENSRAAAVTAVRAGDVLASASAVDAAAVKAIVLDVAAAEAAAAAMASRPTRPTRRSFAASSLNRAELLTVDLR